MAGFLWLLVENRQARVEEESQVKSPLQDFPGGPVVEHLRASAGDTSSILGPGRSPMSWGNFILVQQLLKHVCSRARGLQQEKPLQ